MYVRFSTQLTSCDESIFSTTRIDSLESTKVHIEPTALPPAPARHFLHGNANARVAALLQTLAAPTPAPAPCRPAEARH
eukprot:6189373-Pleurochrysis_carterae.AAC.3